MVGRMYAVGAVFGTCAASCGLRRLFFLPAVRGKRGKEKQVTDDGQDVCGGCGFAVCTGLGASVFAYVALAVFTIRSKFAYSVGAP